MYSIEDGRQIYLSEEQINLLKTLVQPGAEFDDYGSPENEHAVLFKKLFDQQRSDAGAMWVSVYECQQCYGGPEEGGWWYWHYSLEVSEGSTIPEVLVDWFNKWCAQYHDETHEVFDVMIPITMDDLLKATTNDPVLCRSYPIERGYKKMIVLEAQLGSQNTIGRPYYC